MFDPEKVERKRGVLDDANIHAGESGAEFIRASDYDQLLALYRKLRHQMNQGMNDSQAATIEGLRGYYDRNDLTKPR